MISVNELFAAVFSILIIAYVLIGTIFPAYMVVLLAIGIVAAMILFKEFGNG